MGVGNTYLTNSSTGHTKVGRVLVLPEKSLGREGLTVEHPKCYPKCNPSSFGGSVSGPESHSGQNAFDSQEGRLTTCAQTRTQFLKIVTVRQD